MRLLIDFPMETKKDATLDLCDLEFLEIQYATNYSAFPQTL